MDGDRWAAMLSRREWMRILGAGAGIGMLGGLRGDSLLKAAAGQGAAQVGSVAFPKAAIVRTILKDVPPDALGTGTTPLHEHLSSNPAGLGGASGGQPSST